MKATRTRTRTRTRTGWFRSMTAAVLSVSLLTSTGFAAPEDPDAPTQAVAGGPTVIVDEIGDTGLVVAPEVAKQSVPLLQEAGLDPSEATVRISWLDVATFNYAVRVGLRGNPADNDAPILATCRGCQTDELVAAGLEGVRKAIEKDARRAAAEQESQADETPEEDTAAVQPEPTEPAVTDRDVGPRRGLGPMGWGGVGALVTGVAGVATGGAFLGVGETRPEADKSKVRDFRPAGYGLIAVGGALVITGAVLLAVDRSQARKEAILQGRNPRARVGLAASRQGAGFIVSGRF